MNTLACRPLGNAVPDRHSSLWTSYATDADKPAETLNSSAIISYLKTCSIPFSAAKLADDTTTTLSDARRSVEKSRLIAQVVAYQTLADDWDGYGGVPASLGAVADAVALLTAMPASLPLPKPMIAGNGVIGLYWEANDRYASIDFDGGGDYCYIADRPDSEHGEDQVPVSQGLTQDLIEVIAETADQT